MTARHEHPAFDGGSCSRCGCSRRMAACCPPGFWMTSEEHDRWSALDGLPNARRYAAQSALECELVTRSAGQSESADP